jgi:hypothetical protein
MINHATEPVTIRNDITPNNILPDPVCLNNMTSNEITIMEMVMTVLREFNTHCVYESYPNPNPDVEYDQEDYIVRFILPSQRTCDRFGHSIMSVYLERVDNDDNEDQYHLDFTTGLEDTNYYPIDDYTSRLLNFTFETRLECMANLRRIMHRYYLPFSTVEVRMYQLLREHIRRNNQSHGVKRLGRGGSRRGTH